jgi:hypothetical protein
MSETIGYSVIANNNLFLDWLTATNQMINLLATDSVTANSTANGSQTSGNGFVQGIFGAITLVGNSIGGGFVSQSANLYLTSNLIASNCSLNATAVGWGTGHITQINVQTSGLSAQIIDTFPDANSTTAEYGLTVTANPGNGYQTSKLLVLNDTASHAYATEWAQMNTNGALGVFSANVGGGNVSVYFTPAVSNCQVVGYKIKTYLG